MPKKVLDFPMQIDKHIVINSCDNQEYIAHPTKGECDDKKEEKAHLKTKEEYDDEKNKAHPKSEQILFTSNHLAYLPSPWGKKIIAPANKGFSEHKDVLGS